MKRFLFLCCAMVVGLSVCSRGVVFANDAGRNNAGRYNEVGIFNSWFADVRLQLSDNEPDCKYMKKLQIFGVPPEFELDSVDIANHDCWRFGSVLVGKSNKDNRRDSSGLIFNADENCYEVNFNPILSDGRRFDRQVLAENLTADDFFIKVYTVKKDAVGDVNWNKHSLDVFYAKVSNDGLKSSKVFPGFAGMRIERVVREGKSYLKFVGVPDGIEEIYVSSVDERELRSEKEQNASNKPDGSSKADYDGPLLEDVIIKKNEAGEFMTRFNPLRDVNHTIYFGMKDGSGFEYFFWLDFSAKIV